MFNFLHTFNPEPILINLGSITIYWYGLFIVSGILLGILVSLKLARYYDISKDTVINLIFWLVIGGVLGARLYHVFLELSYYRENPLNIFAIWNGGLAIHGGIFAGLLIIYLYTLRHKLNFFLIGFILAPSIALAQAIGRWGNYFNEELYGLPTDLPWGIPIEPANRILAYFNSQYFHPTFLYESIGNLIIFIFLIALHVVFIQKKRKNYHLGIIFYLVLYSSLRFFLEFIRIDKTPEFFGLRWPQITSLFIIFVVIFILLPKIKKSVNV